ncbi:MAG: polysaccharide deacetylase family protein [Patescibacteria group bacterium]|nr:polysaccharide deacetylase family protein [Patescibacteria group bacterium]
MLPRLRTLALLVVLCAAVSAGVFLVAHDLLGTYRLALHVFSQNEAAYAEFGTVSAEVAAGSAASARSVYVPILVYHIVRPSYPSDSAAVRRLALTPETFDAELSHLSEAGYRVVSFGDLEAYFASGTPLPAKPILLSFDDGWQNQFTYAFPILKKHGFSATFFVFTNAIGRRGFMTWDELKRMREAGMTIGAHSRSHPYLTKIADPAALWDEIAGSKAVLEQRLGVPVTVFAYPFGQYDPSVVADVARAGYRLARGDFYAGGMVSAERPYELGAMNAPTTTELFAKKFPAAR